MVLGDEAHKNGGVKSADLQQATGVCKAYIDPPMVLSQLLLADETKSS